MKIAELPLDERPREKALHFGIASLSDAELLALLLGKGSHGFSALELAYRLLGDFGSLPSLGEAPLPSLTGYPGIKGVKALTLQAVFELAKRIGHQKENMSSYSPKTLFEYLKHKQGENERAYLFALDGLGKIKAEKLICEGIKDSSPLQLKDVISAAMRLGSSRFVLVHSHPSGDCRPSEGDMRFTLDLLVECESLALRLLDHLIVSPTSYFSFSENGIL